MCQEPKFEIAAVGSRELSSAQEWSKQHELNDITTYGSYDELVNDDSLDAIYCALPSGLHPEWVSKIARSGKHLLLEKPIANTIDNLNTVASEVAQGGIQFMDGTMWIHNPRTEAMQQVLEQKDLLGEVLRAVGQFTFTADKSFFETDVRVTPGLDDLGALGDQGAYCIRGVTWAFGSDTRPLGVQAHPGSTYNDKGILMMCGATVHYGPGKVGIIDCGFTGAFR